MEVLECTTTTFVILLKLEEPSVDGPGWSYRWIPLWIHPAKFRCCKSK